MQAADGDPGAGVVPPAGLRGHVACIARWTGRQTDAPNDVSSSDVLLHAGRHRELQTCLTQRDLTRSSNVSWATGHVGLLFVLVVRNGHTSRLKKLLTLASCGSSNMAPGLAKTQGN
jgi:hypothetical protein